MKALELLRARSYCRFGAEVELIKRIPSSAGLGGASSDAAAALRLANWAWQLDWPHDRLAELAAEIGSDVPFFLQHGPAICRGRGEKVEPLRWTPPWHFVIVKPPIELRTANVYQAYDGFVATTTGGRAGRASDFSRVFSRPNCPIPAAWMHNGLQAAAAALSPWVDRLRAVFDRLDFIAHQLSGSGSAYFGVCRHALHARRLTTLLRTQQLGLVYATKSYR